MYAAHYILHTTYANAAAAAAATLDKFMCLLSTRFAQNVWRTGIAAMGSTGIARQILSQLH